MVAIGFSVYHNKTSSARTVRGHDNYFLRRLYLPQEASRAVTLKPMSETLAVAGSCELPKP